MLLVLVNLPLCILASGTDVQSRMGGIVSSLQPQREAGTPDRPNAAEGTTAKVTFAEPVAQDATPATGPQPALGSALKRSGRPRSTAQDVRRVAGQPMGLAAGSIAAVAAPQGPAAAASAQPKPVSKRGRKPGAVAGRKPVSKKAAARAAAASPAAAAAAGPAAKRGGRAAAAGAATPGARKVPTKRTVKRQLQPVEKLPTQEKRRVGRPRKHPVQ